MYLQSDQFWVRAGFKSVFMEPNHSDRTKFDRRRFNAALVYQGRSLARFTAALGRWCPRHVAFVMSGTRTGSAALLDASHRELGESGWRFVIGKVDSLTDEGRLGSLDSGPPSTRNGERQPLDMKRPGSPFPVGTKPL